MKLADALDIADSCGLDTYGEAIYNVNLHAPSLFGYDELHKELNELNKEYSDTAERLGISIEELSQRPFGDDHV